MLARSLKKRGDNQHALEYNTHKFDVVKWLNKAAINSRKENTHAIYKCTSSCMWVLDTFQSFGVCDTTVKRIYFSHKIMTLQKYICTHHTKDWCKSCWNMYLSKNGFEQVLKPHRWEEVVCSASGLCTWKHWCILLTLRTSLMSKGKSVYSSNTKYLWLLIPLLHKMHTSLDQRHKNRSNSSATHGSEHRCEVFHMHPVTVSNHDCASLWKYIWLWLIFVVVSIGVCGAGLQYTVFRPKVILLISKRESVLAIPL